MALSTINATTGLTDGTVTSAKLADFAAAVDLNGVELVLDADQDTSITADTDDRIDFKIAGVEHFSFSNSSGDTIIKPMVDAKDIKLQQFDGRTLLDINDAGFVGIENGATGPGAIRIFEDTDNGSNYVGLSVGNVSTSYTLVFPNADGSSGQVMTTNGSGVLSFADASANTPSSADGQALGSASLEWSDLFLADASTIQFGNDQDVILTHVADTGLLLSGTNVIQFIDASQNIGAPSATVLDINATNEIELNATLVDVNANLDVSGTIVGASTISGTTITATTAFVPDASDGAALGTTALEFSDLFLADASTIQFGADQDVILTHVADTGLLLSGTNVIQFNDASQNIGAPSNAILDINATDEIELNATLVDINGNVEISGTTTLGGNLIVGSATVTEAQLEILDGATVTTTELNLLDGGTSVGSSITLADGDGFVVNDGGAMKTIPASDIKTYNPGGTAWQSVVTGATTMVSGRGYFVNTTSSAFAMTLPSSASIGDYVQIIDYAGTADTNNITIGRNSHKIQGEAADLVVTTERAAFTLVYVDSTQGWLLDSK